MKKSKKIISLLLSVLMIITSIPLMAVNSNAVIVKEITSGDYKYKVYDGEAFISGYIGPDKDIVIPAEIDGYKVKNICDYAFSNKNIENVVISYGIKCITAGFENCSSLKSITFPETVEKIDGGAFNNCTSLESLTIPDGVKELGMNSLNNCTSLKTITFGKEYNPSEIELSSIFFNCNAIESINVSEKNENFCSVDGVMYSKDMTKLVLYPSISTKTEFTIPKSVSTIYETAFNNTKNIETLNIIGNIVKSGRIKSKTYNIGADVSIISDTLVLSAVENFDVAKNNNTFSSVDGILYNKAKTRLIKYPLEKTGDTFNIPNGVEKIGHNAFESCKVKHITFPKSLVEIEKYAFNNSSLTDELVIPNNIKTIGDYAFSGTGVTTLVINSNLNKTGTETFGIKSLKKLVINADLRDFVLYFKHMTELTTVEYGENITHLDFNMLDNLYGLQSINVSENNKIFSSVDGIVFNKEKTKIIKVPIKKELSAYYVPDGVTEIGEDAFYNSCITELYTPKSLKKIGKRAFNDCYGLVRAELNGTDLEICESAFYHCSFAKGLVLNEGVKSIATNAFYSISLKGDLVLPVSLQRIDNYAFCADTPFNIVIKSDIKDIGLDPFFHCYFVQKLTFEEGVTEWNHGYVFQWLQYLDTLEIKGNLIDVDEDIFIGAFSPKKLVIGENVTELNSDFALFKTLEEINVSDNNKYFSSIDGVLFDKSGKVLISYPKQRNTETYKLPDSTIAINDYAFSKNIKLKSVILNDGLQVIGDYAFSHTIKLDVKIPDSLVAIGEGAFLSSHKSSAEVPKNVQYIGDAAFGYYEEYDNGQMYYQLEENFVLRGERGSAAEEYALANGINFEYTWFPDVSCREWYYDAIRYNVDNNYFHGYANGYFGPGNNIQRQDFVVVLAKIAGVDLSAYAGQNGGFSDVPTNDYYSAAVAWAKDNHILSGYVNGKFGVGDPITREQACLIFYNYCSGEVSGDVNTVLAGYPDGGNVSDWARTAVAWAAENRVVGGNGKLNPAGNANRAEMAQIIMNMSSNNIL